jgi:uncharacterized protein YegP (UPF0339 family)
MPSWVGHLELGREPVLITLTGALAFLAFLPWVISAIGFVAFKPRRTYLWTTGSSAAIREATAVRQMGLTYTGLVFAGLALATGPGAAHRSVPEQLLVVALAAAAIAWAVSNIGAVAWVADVAEAGLLLSVACILLAMAEILWSGDALVNIAITVAIGLAYGVVLALSVFFAWSHWNEARPPAEVTEAVDKFAVRRSEEYHFVIMAADGTVIATSEPYPSKQAATEAIESVRSSATDAIIDDETG